MSTIKIKIILKKEKPMTKNGKLIMEIIYASNDHLTAEQIFLRAKETAPGMVLATVYNNLKTLVAEGLVRRVTMEDGPDRYDRPMRHDHLICVKCGKISDLMFKDLSEKLERDIGVPILSYDLHIHYICDECRKQK